MQLSNSVNFVFLTGVFWCLFFMYWIVAARDTKKNVYQQTLWGRVFIITRLISCFALIYLPALSIGWLGQQLIHKSLAIELIGSLFCAIGLLFAVWSRRTLGRNWSGTITLKQNHKLIQEGPYRLARHPIYTGLVMAWLGSAITLGEVRGVLAMAITFLGLWGKLKQEESLLLQQFPIEYPEYKQRVKALIPFLF